MCFIPTHLTHKAPPYHNFQKFFEFFFRFSEFIQEYLKYLIFCPFLVKLNLKYKNSIKQYKNTQR